MLGLPGDFMTISARRSYYWLEQNVFGFALIEIFFIVCACVGFVLFGFNVLEHLGVK
jgi:hypothetical protein